MKEIESLQHPIVKTFVKLRTLRKERLEKKLIVLSGIKLCHEAKQLEVLLVKKGFVSSLPAKEMYVVTETILKKVTGLETPEPLAGIALMPTWATLQGKSLLLALDGISDPGNLGSLLRTALALGWEGVFLTPTCVDPYNDKALRASMGATLRLPLRSGTIEELKSLIESEHLSPLVADMEGRSLKQLSIPQKPLLILGSESHGISPVLKATFPSVAIPIRGIESLNVAAAGAILMYTLKP